MVHQNTTNHKLNYRWLTTKMSYHITNTLDLHNIMFCIIQKGYPMLRYLGSMDILDMISRKIVKDIYSQNDLSYNKNAIRFRMYLVCYRFPSPWLKYLKQQTNIFFCVMKFCNFCKFIHQNLTNSKSYPRKFVPSCCAPQPDILKRRDHIITNNTV